MDSRMAFVASRRVHACRASTSVLDPTGPQEYSPRVQVETPYRSKTGNGGAEVLWASGPVPVRRNAGIQTEPRP